MRAGTFWPWALLFFISWGCDDAPSSTPAPTPVDAGEVDAATPDAGAVDAAPMPDAAPEPDACVPGSADCACDADGECGAGLFCAGGVCRVPRCDPGDEGCPCFDDDTCRTGPDGRPMACEDDLCRVTACPSGAEGCGCLPFDACDAGLVCQDTRCLDPGCAPGAANCICDGDGGCDAGLLCDAGRCLDPGCRLGSADCRCDAGGGCDDGLACEAGHCVEPCPTGARGCACDDAGHCDGALGCVDDQCVELGCAPGSLGCICDDLGACRDGNTCQSDRCVPRDCSAGGLGCVCLNERCNAGLECDALGICQGCPAGADGCACRNGTCDPGLVCGGDETCAPPACEPGAEGCECAFGDACGLNDRGEVLDCIGDLCVAESCAPGATGCACVGGTACDARTDGCVNGFCQPQGCAPGTADCACADGRCGEGLLCRADAICVDGTGFEGGPCAADETCRPGNVCTLGQCVACERGTVGCDCLNGRCGDGRCVDDICVDPATLPPDNPLCFTPCAQSFEDQNGVYRRCDADGLMQGCVQDRRCVQGSCVVEGEAPPVCEGDTECPDYQRCIAGGCYSECTRDDACGAGQECYRRVCRTPCRSGEVAAIGCPAETFCDTNDGELGYCMPLVPAAEDPQFEVNGGIVVGRTALEFTNADTVETITLTNEAPTPETVVVRKISHTVLRADASQDERRDDGDCDPVRDCPLFWLTMGPEGARQPGNQVEIELAPGESRVIEIGDADQVAGVRWDGVLAIEHPSLNQTRVILSYSQTPAGAWTGSVYYFGAFGTQDLETWSALPNPAPGSAPNTWRGTKDDAEIQERVGNALVQRWGAFRRGRITWDEFLAVLTATESESWRWQSVMDDCPEAACYLYRSNRLGLREYSSDLDSVPVPSGVVELPFAANLRVDDDAPNRMVGRIESANALQYAGNPEISLQFDGDPQACGRTVGGACSVYLSDFNAHIALGGRYESDANDQDCARHPDGSYVQFRTPWLVPGFTRNTTLDPQTGVRYRHECRDTQLPIQLGDDIDAETRANLALTGANPVPDGRARRRTLELVDGALINQSLMFVLFKERFESFLDPEGDSDGFEAYGYMLLRRDGRTLDDTDDNDNDIPDIYEGSAPEDDRAEPTDVLSVTCDDALARDLLDGAPLNNQTANRLTHALIDGVQAPAQAAYLDANDVEKPHYLCHDTGAFDDECPEASEVTYFTVDSAVMDADAILDLDCNAAGDCLETLLDWRDDPDSAVLVQADAHWRCAEDRAVFCAANRFDLRDGKIFYAAAQAESADLSMWAQVNDAFRYKTRFRSRQGRNIGFAPEICLPDSNQRPYCYDPAAIEDLRLRGDCLLHIQDRYYARLDVDTRDALDTYLMEHFSYAEERVAPDTTIQHDGFERLYAELLVMQGDEAITRSFASRFDLAGQALAAFEGSLFEDGGIDLSGQVGFEMFTLYRSVQYYQEALDRFYALSPRIWQAIQLGADRRNFVTSDTVTWYFDRLVRASSQKTRAWSQIAERYQGFNRPDLARRVIERAYTGAYLESIIMSRMMLRIVGSVAPEDRAQIRQIIEQTQRRYRVALLDMREVYAGITDQQGFLGIAPDFVPIPALDSEDFRQSNGFEVMLRRTQNKVQVARLREDQAIESNRSFDSDSAQFQAELVRIRNTYEDQLAQICGVFTGEDGVVYPAIAKYADRLDYTAGFGDPCGFVGNGQIYEQAAQLDILRVDLQRLVTQTEGIYASVEIERQRAEQQCGLQLALADYQYRAEGEVDSMEFDISLSRSVVQRADRSIGAMGTSAQLLSCSPVNGQCGPAAAATTAFKVGLVGVELGAAAAEGVILQREVRINEIRRETARWQTEQQCEYVQTDSNARMADMLIRVNELQVEMLRVDYQASLEISQMRQLQQQARRLQQQQTEAEQLQLDSEAARNDPNIRIYRNDAIINADFHFEDALREAYKLTRVFEYYTSQSFSGQERLYLIRLIARGEYNLENYLIDIENAFFEFEEEFGLPDTRVLQVSLRDDILAIPRVDSDGAPLTEGERTARMREALRDPGRLDSNGYLTLPFATQLGALSPLTRNHKVRFIEAEIVASDFGADHVGRLYVRQSGTGVIRSLDDELEYYRLPVRTAVLNPFFNASRFFDNSIYRNQRMRDRPLVNTAWDLVINQRDEQANQDINLQSITDIRLFIYYTDFTSQF